MSDNVTAMPGVTPDLDTAPTPGENVLPLGGVTKFDIPVDRVLSAAIGNLKGVVILGYDADGEQYFATTYADGGEVLWLLEKCKHELMHIT